MDAGWTRQILVAGTTFVVCAACGVASGTLLRAALAFALSLAPPGMGLAP